MCQVKVKSRSCQFYSRVERMKSAGPVVDKNVMDIEDIVKLGNSLKFCPYFMTHELDKLADIVFMPYNYLLDHNIRRNLGVKLESSIIILDEAHNIEKVCEESASLQLKSSDITLCIEEVTAAMKLLSEQDKIDVGVDIPEDIRPEDLCDLKELFLELEKQIDDVKIDIYHGVTHEATFLLDLLARAGIRAENCGNIRNLLLKLTEFLATIADGPFARKGVALQNFDGMLELIFMGKSNDFWDKVKRCYKVHVLAEPTKKKGMQDNWLSKATHSKAGGKIINYWCFSPGFGMNMFLGERPRCLILTSGTLAPLGPYTCELELRADVKLENPHIVKGDQVCVRIVTKGPDSETLNCNYNNRDNPKFINSVGMTISNLIRMIPGGVLVFFPSYPILHACKKIWEESGLWANINKQKAVFVEPREKEPFNSAMQSYYSNIKEYGGAIFMGVCRGKVSEGLDFVDNNGRAVIIVGLPYPPFKDPKIALKRKYIDLCNSRDKEYPRGEEWYSLEASRAVNQAIGRVIRHSKDYGAILLLDARFDNPRLKSQMSKWLQEHVKVTKNFGELIRDVRGFFKDADQKFQKDRTDAASFSSDAVHHHPAFDFGSSSSSLIKMESASSSKTSEVILHPRKKIKIAIATANGEETQVTETSVQEYITMIQKILDVKSFQELISALSNYKQTDDYETLVKNLDNIFKGKMHLRYLIKGLENYIKRRHRDAFNEYCDSR
ncbi:unnamed protein product [Acanthoscelides obtectus]|nr:unnamed protein product [Acanthoscelides obtectus]CAK1664068.1 Regulator of telomere elongation helicase 1 homolog [Acanthoscelides obtectus]